MKDENKVKGLRFAVLIVNVILAGITVVLQIFDFEPLRHTILCSCVLLLFTVHLICDGILKDIKGLVLHGVWYALGFFSLIVNLFRI